MTGPVAGRRLGVIGWPVERSLSPQIHAAALAVAGLDWTYELLPVPPGRLPAALEGLAAEGFAGVNVTMPHKDEAARLVHERSELAGRLRAVNTVTVEDDGRLVGDDTDAPGFATFLLHDAGFEPAGRTALVLGAGGAARACAWAVARRGAARVIVAARDPSRAEAAVRPALEDTSSSLQVIPFHDAGSSPADLVVNATPLALPPLPPGVPGGMVVDLAYRPEVTPLVRRARDAGATAHTGLGLLLRQAALSFERWTGHEASLEAMRRAAEDALANEAPASRGPPTWPRAEGRRA
jgi:shikimate dehydrogenase